MNDDNIPVSLLLYMSTPSRRTDPEQRLVSPGTHAPHASDINPSRFDHAMWKSAVVPM